MGELSWWHWLIVVLVFVLLFGSKRLPDAARSLGKSMRIFKTEIKALHDDEPESSTPAAALPAGASNTPPAEPGVAAPTTAATPVPPAPAATAPGNEPPDSR